MEKSKALLIGVAAGLAGGLLGIGGGLIMIPCMVYYLGLTQHSAHATSLAVVIPLAVTSALIYNSFGQLDIRLAAYFAVGGVAGAYLGSALMPKVKPRVLRRIFAVVLLLISLRMGLGI